MGSLIYLFAGQYEHAGILGEIIVKADQASVAQELGGNPDRALAAPKQRCSGSWQTAFASW